jgi:hypothetical protein
MMFKVILCSLSALLLVGCTGFSPKGEMTGFTQEGVLFASPSLDKTLVRDPKNHKKICMGRGADALYETSESANFSLSLVSVANTKGDSVGETDNAGEEEMMGRTPAVLLARELFYRACEFTNNAQLDQKESVKIFNSVLNVIGQGWKSEAKNTTVHIGDSLSTKSENAMSVKTSKSSEPVVAGGAGADAGAGADGADAGANGADASAGADGADAGAGSLPP